MADPTMPENPETPKAVISLDAGVEYTVTRQDVVLRNGEQVVIPRNGVNILHELLVVLTHMAKATVSGDAELIAGLTAPPEGADVPSQPGKVTMPPDTTDAAWPKDVPHPSDMTWEGFEVKGSYDNGNISAEVEHRKLPISLSLTYDQAKWVIDRGDPDADTAYEYLACQAFMAWWDRNGLATAPDLPDWEPGTMVEHVETAGLYGVVVDYPGHDHLSILVPGRHLLPITAEHAADIANYRPTNQ